MFQNPVSPPQGGVTSAFVVEGGITFAACPRAVPILVFNFYFDKASGGPQIWTTTVSTCTGTNMDTGPSPGLVPPTALATAGGHVVELDVFTEAGVLVGSQPTQPYTISAAPSLMLDPTCGSVGAPISMHGAGFQPKFPVTIAFTPPAQGAPDGTVNPVGDGTFDVVVPVPNRAPGSYVVVAAQNAPSAFAAGQLLARAAFQVPCIKAAIVLQPVVGPPGTVVTVIGTGFPPNALVKLTWNHGILDNAASIHIDATQGFTLEILIFPHDALGSRRMSASPNLTDPKAPIFNIATADFLVVPGTEQPHDFSWRH